MHYRGWIAVLIFALYSSWSGAQSPREQLQQLALQLRANPSDHALRERIVRLGLEVKPKPAIPSEAERFDGRAQYAFKSAKSEADMLEAAREYLKAVDAAPWVANYYFNLCMILEKANRPAEAMRACKFYLSAAPDAQDASEIRKRVAGLEYALERQRGAVTRRQSCGDMSNLYEVGSKVAVIDGRKISAKLSSALYGGVWRNQLLLTDITMPGNIFFQRYELDPIDKTFRLDDRVPGTPWFRLTIARDGRITLGGYGSSQAEIVTSTAELLQMRNAQMNGCTLAAKDGKFFVELAQGGSLHPKDGARMNGGLYFETDCMGKPVGEKPGWFPAVFIPHPETPGVTSAQSDSNAQGFSLASADACLKASNDGLGWLAP
jgi:tetratricopeptide (TPR) repeat protein